MRRKIFVLITIVMLSCLTGRAQSFRFLTSDDELPSSMVNDLFQDHYGFVWIATENGLVRYDGARFVTYTNIPSDSHSLAHDFVTSLIEDRDGHLYISTYAGVQMYDYGTNRFSENVTWEDGSTFGENSNGLYLSSSGKVYSSGHSACEIIRRDERVLARKLKYSGETKNYSKMLEDTNGQMWVSIRGLNLIMRVRDEQIEQRYEFAESNVTLTDFTMTADGTVYVAVSELGVMEYDPQTDRFEVLLPELSHLHLNNICAIDDRLYILAEQSPIYVYDRKKKSLTQQNLEIGNTWLNEFNPTHFLIDRDGNTWLSIAQQGVLMIPAYNSPFGYLGHRVTNADQIGKNPVTAVFEDSDGYIWVGTSGDGLYCLNDKAKRVAHYEHPAVVTGFFEDTEGDIWVTSSSSGVSRLNRKTKRIADHAIRTSSGALTTAHDIESDVRGRMWVGSMGNGLYCFDKQSNLAISINEISPDIHKWVDRVFVANDGTLWLGTYDGLERVNIQSSNYDHVRFLKRTIVYDIAQGKDQTLWLATSVGLLNVSNEGDTLQMFTTEDGLPSQSLASLQLASDGSIWVSSNKGLSKVDPEKRTVTNYYTGDGLQGNEFSKCASMTDRQGRMWFGGNNGVTYFTPNSVRADSRLWQVRIVAMTLADREVSTATLSGGHPVTTVPIYESEQVTLDHEDHAFTVYFATEELNCPETMQFEYRLNDQPWQRLPVGVHSVSFSNMPTGINLFAVRAVNNQRESTVKTLRIVIRPHWYETWWFMLLALLLLALITALVFMTVRSHYREKNERLLTENMEAVHDAQTRLFIDLTHEIRTPLMLILGPIKKLLAQDDDASRRNSYGTIQRNANRIMRLMDQMIDMRRMDKGVLNLHFEECNLVETVGNVFADFQEQARIKRIDLTFVHEGLSQLPVWVDSGYFDKIIINLVSNALKYTPTGGKVQIALSRLGDEKARIAVIDNGPGVPVGDRERIFDRFYRGKNADGSKIQGSGIGLSLTRSLVEKHHGTMGLESSTEPPTGSTFWVELPLGRKHLADSEIVNVTVPDVVVSDETTPANLETVEDNPHAKTKYHVLIVDDEEEILQYLKHELSTDFHVAGCNNGKEALSMLLNVKFDLVISDVMMPVMDGEALCRKIRQNINLNHLPVILLTANTEEEAMISGLDTGADEYMVKPVSMNLLRTRVYNLIHGRERLYNNYAGKQIEESKLEELHVKTPDEQLMERIMREVNNNLSNPELTVEMLADKVGMSRVHLNRKLKELTNQTARDFIRNIRLRQAATLLEQGNHQVNRIAELVGFTNVSNFTTAFHALYGVAPKDYPHREG